MKTPRPPGLLVLAVLALHLLLGHEVQRLHEGWLREGPMHMPERIKVALVREMQVQPPRTARPPPVPPAALSPAPAADRQAGAEAASAPASEPTSEAASAPPAVAPLASQPPVAAPVAVAGAADAASAAAAVAEAASAPTDGEPGPEWPLSTRLTYALTGNYRGPVHGQAQVEWLRRGRDYQVHLDVSIGPSFAPLMSRRMSSQGQLTPDGIAPQRYDEETRVLLGEPRRSTVFFLRATPGSRVPARRGAQDSASQFVQLTWLFLTGREPLQAGHVVRFPLALPRRQYDDWSYAVVDETSIETGFGGLPVWHLRPERPAQPGDLVAEVWLAPGLQHLPVRLLIRQDAETWIDLTLKQLPLQAAPESGHDIPRRLSQ